MKPDPSLFRFWHPVQVRFKDIDVGGHAHHSLSLIYFEEARTTYWREVVGMGDLSEIDFILAEARIRYHERVLYPQELSVGVRVRVMGKKHFVMEYLARTADGTELLSGETTMVMYDYVAGKTKKIPPDTRSAIESWEGSGRVEGGA